ncbi:MAG: porin family protein [Bacteroidota bacterium]
MSAQGVFAQSYGTHPFDFKRFNLGFQMGLNQNRYNLKDQIQICEDGICLEQINMIPKVGMTLGMITNYNLHDQVSLRFIPSVSLEQRDFDYFFDDSPQPVIRKIEAAYFNMPFMVQFKTKYYKRSRIFVNLGAQVGLNLNSNKKVLDDPDLLKIKKQDFSLVIGGGINLYGDRIKLSPEIRYTAGLTNVYVPENTTHATAISQLFSQVLAFIVNFE